MFAHRQAAAGKFISGRGFTLNGQAVLDPSFVFFQVYLSDVLNHL